MITPTLLVSSVLLLSGSAYAQQTAWGQCGGKNWSGATTCVSGYSCVEVNEWYFQCQPGSAPTTQIPSPTPSPTSTPTPSNGGGSTKTSSTSSIPEGTGTPTGPGTTLQSGYLWIRAVAAPNFHKYLQSSPLLSTGSAVMESYTTAGQFVVQSDGQLAQLVSGPGQAAQFLYANVGKEKIHANKTLRVTWSKDKGTYGKFAWQGDSLIWSTSDISRPNSAAWYVCGKQELFVNLGNYLSDTPSGCADQTIHYYNDSKANN